MPASKPKPYLKWCPHGEHWAVRNLDFAKDKRRKDSVAPWCYDCFNKYRRRKYHENVEASRSACNLRQHLRRERAKRLREKEGLNESFNNAYVGCSN